jgi:hypothetical protein
MGLPLQGGRLVRRSRRMAGPLKAMVVEGISRHLRRRAGGIVLPQTDGPLTAPLLHQSPHLTTGILADPPKMASMCLIGNPCTFFLHVYLFGMYQPFGGLHKGFLNDFLADLVNCKTQCLAHPDGSPSEWLASRTGCTCVMS